MISRRLLSVLLLGPLFLLGLLWGAGAMSSEGTSVAGIAGLATPRGFQALPLCELGVRCFVVGQGPAEAIAAVVSSAPLGQLGECLAQGVDCEGTIQTGLGTCAQVSAVRYGPRWAAPPDLAKTYVSLTPMPCRLLYFPLVFGGLG